MNRQDLAGTSAPPHRCRGDAPEHRALRIGCGIFERGRHDIMRFRMGPWTMTCAAALVALGSVPAQAQVFHSAGGDVTVETVAKGLDHPWALAFLPDGRMLVTERPGRMRIVGPEGKLSPGLHGLLKVFAAG